MKMALLLLSFVATAAQAVPTLSSERVVFRTLGGDIVMALYPEVAPKTVGQFLKMSRAGVYDTIHFYRVEPGFVVQTSTAADRLIPFTPEQKSIISKIPAEFSTVKHHRGSLSMAREDGNIDSGETSFSILLGDAPHLDGQYTVFGEVLSGMDVVDQFLSVPQDGRHRPRVRIGVQKVFVVKSDAVLKKTPLEPARAIFVPPSVFEQIEAERSPAGGAAQKPLVIGLILMILLGSVAGLFPQKIPPKILQSLLLAIVLVAYFNLFVILGPQAKSNGFLASGVFLSLLGLFKLMGRFESAG